MTMKLLIALAALATALVVVAGPAQGSGTQSVNAYLYRSTGAACTTSECRLIVNAATCNNPNYCYKNVGNCPPTYSNTVNCFIPVNSSDGLPDIGPFNAYARIGTSTAGCYWYSNVAQLWVYANVYPQWVFLGNANQRACGGQAVAALKAMGAVLQP